LTHSRPGKSASQSLQQSPRFCAVFLIGYMGAGKTTVGRLLATQLNWTFVDLDDWIESRERRAIAKIFQTSGEAQFRLCEHAALEQLTHTLSAAEPKIIALGGGAYTQPQNADLVQSTGEPVVFLDAQPDELWRRCHNQVNVVERPMMRDREDFHKLYAARQRSYETGSWRLDTTAKSMETVAEEIAGWLARQSRLKKKEEA
jgi:shikimate kinase